jgi:hypothetical protein
MNPSSDTDDEMRADYSDLFATQTPVRSNYYEQAMRAKQMVQIDKDLLDAFPTAAELNATPRGPVESSKHVHNRAAA